MSNLFKSFLLFIIAFSIPPIGAFLVVHYFNKCNRLEFERSFEDETLQSVK